MEAESKNQARRLAQEALKSAKDRTNREFPRALGDLIQIMDEDAKHQMCDVTLTERGWHQLQGQHMAFHRILKHLED